MDAFIDKIKKYNRKTDLVFKKLPNLHQMQNYYDGQPSYYYYKRWLWIIFPWACMSDNVHKNYSEQIKISQGNNNTCMTFEEEQRLNKRAFMITLDARVSKKMILTDAPHDSKKGSGMSHRSRGASTDKTGKHNKHNRQ